jgi:hypothetical protein
LSHFLSFFLSFYSGFTFSLGCRFPPSRVIQMKSLTPEQTQVITNVVASRFDRGALRLNLSQLSQDPQLLAAQLRFNFGNRLHVDALLGAIKEVASSVRVIFFRFVLLSLHVLTVSFFLGRYI